MKLPGGVEWALHCCVVLSVAGRPVPAGRLATLHDVSGSYLAKQLQALAGADLIRSLQGKGGGYVLARPADDVTVLDVVEALDGSGPSFECTEIRQRGPCATPAEQCTAPCGINAVMLAADRAWRKSLSGTTIADLAKRADRSQGRNSLDPVRSWLADA